jgi:hypothetical protein
VYGNYRIESVLSRMLEGRDRRQSCLCKSGGRGVYLRISLKITTQFHDRESDELCDLFYSVKFNSHSHTN